MEHGGALRFVSPSLETFDPRDPLDRESRGSSDRMEVGTLRGWNHDQTEGSPPSASPFQGIQGDWPKWASRSLDSKTLTMLFPAAQMPAATAAAAAWPAPLR